MGRTAKIRHRRRRRSEVRRALWQQEDAELERKIRELAEQVVEDWKPWAAIRALVDWAERMKGGPG